MNVMGIKERIQLEKFLIVRFLIVRLIFLVRTLEKV